MHNKQILWFRNERSRRRAAENVLDLADRTIVLVHPGAVYQEDVDLLICRGWFHLCRPDLLHFRQVGVLLTTDPPAVMQACPGWAICRRFTG